MGRKRLIDTDELYFDSMLVKALGWKGVNFYVRLWGIAEDWGGYEPNRGDLIAKMGLLSVTGEEVDFYLNRLVRLRKVVPYYVNGGKEIHWIRTLLKHQPLKNPAMPKLDLPPWIDMEVKTYPGPGRKFASFKLLEEKIPSDFPPRYKSEALIPLSLYPEFGLRASEDGECSAQILAPTVIKDNGELIEMIVKPPWQVVSTSVLKNEELKRNERNENKSYIVCCILTNTTYSSGCDHPDPGVTGQVAENSKNNGNGSEGLNPNEGLKEKKVRASKAKPEVTKDQRDALLALWNEMHPIPTIGEALWTAKRDAKMASRLKFKPDLEGFWRVVFQKVADNPFLRGEEKPPWKADLDWLIANDENAVKVFEGKYDRKQKGTGGEGPKKRGKYDDLIERG